MQPLIQFKNTDFAVTANKKIIKNFSIDIAADDFVVILGSNGSGKSTLLKLLNRSYQHTNGEIIFKGENINKFSNHELQKEMITISQFMSDSLFLDLTVEENAILIESSYLKSIKKSFNKKDFVKSLPDYLSEFNKTLSTHLKTPVNKLSGGEQRILALALYMRRNPSVILLDEHTSALDPNKSKMVMKFIQDFLKRKQIACLMTTHQLDFALEYGNRVIAICDGKLLYSASGAEKEKLSAQDLLAYCY